MVDPEAGDGDAAGKPEVVGQTGPGIPDDSASPGYDPVADTQAAHDADREEPPGADTLFNGP